MSRRGYNSCRQSVRGHNVKRRSEKNERRRSAPRWKTGRRQSVPKWRNMIAGIAQK
jgi:hypothetical protein